MVRQLIYVSAGKDGDIREEAEQILSSARRNNAKVDVTGILIYSNRVFLQALEGEPEHVGRIFDRISADPRHRVTAILSDDIVDQRAFEEWSMAWRDLPSDDPLAKTIQGIATGSDVVHGPDALLEAIISSFLDDQAA